MATKPAEPATEGANTPLPQPQQNVPSMTLDEFLKSQSRIEITHSKPKPKVPVISLSDDQGNSLRVDGGFVDVDCDGVPQDINLAKAMQFGAVFGPTAKSAVQKAEKVSETMAGQIVKELKLPKGASKKGGKGVPEKEILKPGFDIQAVLPLVHAMNSVTGIDIKLQVKDGDESPIGYLCTVGKLEGILRDRAAVPPAP